MASSGSLGTSNLKVSSFNFCREKHCVFRPCVSLAMKEYKTLKYGSSVKSQRPSGASAVRCGSVLDIPSGSEDKYSGSVSNLVPNIEEVETLITNLCDTTSIAEIDLRLAGFQLHVVRNLNENHEPPPPSPPLFIENSAQSQNSNGQFLSTSLAIEKLLPSSSLEVVPTFLDKAADAGLAILQSPRVGYFRRSRTIKGKRAPPSCKEKQMVKEGQVICYIEQLGGELPIESDVSGEVIRILREDGEPVGYGDALIAILPSFPGIKKLQ